MSVLWHSGPPIPMILCLGSPRYDPRHAHGRPPHGPLQDLDHFDPLNTQTWKQRYTVHPGNVSTDAPIFREPRTSFVAALSLMLC